MDLWIGAIERINQAGINQIVAIHRGFSSYDKSTLYPQSIDINDPNLSSENYRPGWIITIPITFLNVNNSGSLEVIIRFSDTDLADISTILTVS